MAAFFLSLLLSIIAIMGAATIGKDSAFYLDIAQDISDQGLTVAQERFNWPGLMIILAGLHQLTGLSFENLGHGLCSLLMAGTCALIVACIKRVQPHLVVLAVAAVLSIPSFNSFREDILREYGFWFFSALTFWLALVWHQRPTFLGAAAIYTAVLGAALFRLEALFLILALFIWRLSDLRDKESIYAFLRFHALPLIAMALGFVFFRSDALEQSRVDGYLLLLSPGAWGESYQMMAQDIVQSTFKEYLEDEAEFILLFVLVMTVFLFFIKGCGIWALPLLYKPSWKSLSEYWRHYRLFAWAAIVYCGILMVFLVREGFINSRYTSLLHLLMLPFLVGALSILVERFKSIRPVVFVLVLIMALSNVISLGAKKTHYVAAGEWVAHNIAGDQSVYFQDGRIGYYAKRGYLSNPLSVEQALSLEPPKYRFFALEAKTDEPWLQRWLQVRQLKVLAQFANSKGQTVVVVGPALGMQ